MMPFFLSPKPPKDTSLFLATILWPLLWRLGEQYSAQAGSSGGTDQKAWGFCEGLVKLLVFERPPPSPPRPLGLSLLNSHSCPVTTCSASACCLSSSAADRCSSRSRRSAVALILCCRCYSDLLESIRGHLRSSSRRPKFYAATIH